MPRRKRQDEPGTLHHVTNRGIAKRTVFERTQDVRFFLSRVAYAVRRGEIRIHAYNCVTTHFHAFVESPRGELATAFRRIQGEYSRYFNRSRRRDGTLYRRRYHSKVVNTVAYQDNLIRYIDANAVEAGLVAKPEWHMSSSAYWYARGEGPLWLTRTLVEARAAARCGTESFRPDLYPVAFKPMLSPGHEEWILKRLAAGEGPPDALDDLISAAPTKVLSWMRRKAALADGTEIGMPLVPWQAVEESLRLEADRLRAVQPSDGRGCPWSEIARAGLFRDVCCLSYGQIARITGCSDTAATHRVRRHRALLDESTQYAEAVAIAAHRAFGTIR
ncbi:MAG: transposase [Planctomycetes bacterium]|nr:transposase [Planctomycetota bacterium]